MHAHSHDHGHDHGHSHGGQGHGGHGHGPPADFGRAFAIGIAANSAYILGEVFYGVVAHSMALLADAGHNLGDVLGLGAAWLAASLGKRAPGGRYTYGLRRSSILAALGNAVVLLVVTGAVAWESLLRLWAPEPAAGWTIVVVAAAGVVVNGGTALLFAAGRKGDLNVKGAFLHLASDALIAAGVAVAGAVILLTGWLWLDPAASLLVSVLIVWGTWSLLRDSTSLAMDAVPPGVDQAGVSAFLHGLPGVTEVHDLHIWGMSTTETALTVHLVRPDAGLDDALLQRAEEELREHYGIAHATFQVENRRVDHACALLPGGAV